MLEIINVAGAFDCCHVHKESMNALNLQRLTHYTQIFYCVRGSSGEINMAIHSEN